MVIATTTQVRTQAWWLLLLHSWMTPSITLAALYGGGSSCTIVRITRHGRCLLSSPTTEQITTKVVLTLSLYYTRAIN